MANRLKNLKLERIDLVDAPANPGARVVLVKRDEGDGLCPGCPECQGIMKKIRHRNGKWEVTNEEGTKVLGTHDSKQDAQRQLAAIEANKDAPGIGAVHVNSPDLGSRSRQQRRKRSNMSKNAFAKLVKGFRHILKEAEAEAEGRHSFVPKEGDAESEPGSPEHESAEMAHIKELEHLHQKMAEAMQGAQYPDDHPMKMLHKEIGEKLAAAKEAMGPTNKDAEADDEAAEGEDMGRVHKSVALVNKRLEEVTKRAEAAEKRAADAEVIAKRERDERETQEVRVELRKFAHVTIDVEKQAPIMKKLRDTDKALYDSTLETLRAANEAGKLAKSLQDSVGSATHQAGEGSAWAEICAEADKLIAKDTSMTKEKARNLVMERRTDLTKRYYAENGQNDPVAGVQ